MPHILERPLILERIGAEDFTMQQWADPKAVPTHAEFSRALGSVPVLAMPPLFRSMDDTRTFDKLNEAELVLPFSRYYVEAALGTRDEKDHLGLLIDSKRREDGGWHVSAIGIYSFTGHRVVAGRSKLELILDSNGCIDPQPGIMPTASHPAPREEGSVFYIEYRGVRMMMPLGTFDSEEIRQAYHTLGQLLFVGSLHLLQAHEFLSAKNIEAKPRPYVAKPRLKKQMKSRFGGIERYYTLKLNGMGKNRHLSMDLSEALYHLPEHSRRGFWRHYTAERPLFGNPGLVGKWYNPPCMPGNKAFGVITKNYKIDPAA